MFCLLPRNFSHNVYAKFFVAVINKPFFDQLKDFYVQTIDKDQVSIYNVMQMFNVSYIGPSHEITKKDKKKHCRVCVNRRKR